MYITQECMWSESKAANSHASITPIITTSWLGPDTDGQPLVDGLECFR